MESVKENETKALDQPQSPLILAIKRLFRSRIAVAGLVVLVILILVAIFAPQVATHDPTAQNLRMALKPPSAENLLGTDHNGRDIFSRMVYGSRVSLYIGLLVVTIRAGIGIPLGLVAGYFGGRIDNLIMRLTDIVIVFPGILLALAIMSIWGPGLNKVLLALAFTGWPEFARLVRGEVLALREREYVEAGRALGLSHMRIMGRHILPNVLPTLIVYSTISISAPIVSEAALSFLGLGIQPPEVSWGSMLADARSYIRVAPWFATLPGIAITITVVGFNLLGDGLRDALDPRMKQ